MQNFRRTRSSRVGLAVWLSILPGAVALSQVVIFAADEQQKQSAKSAAKHPLEPAIQLAQTSRAALDAIDDYTALFSQRERVGNRMFSHSMMIKHRRRPFSVYMKYVGQHKGREVIYVDGQNEGKLLAHDTGIGSVVGTIALVPDRGKAMSESKFPITDFGMLKLVDRVIAEWEADMKHGEIQVKYQPSVRVGKTECRMVETTHPQQRSHFVHHRVRLYIDKGTNLPVRVEHFGFPAEQGDDPPLVAEYQYTDIRINQALADRDFDIENASYGFK
jgi:hypothetical protein